MRTGRPPIFRERVYVHVLLEATELAALHRRAEEAGVSASAFVRALIQREIGTTAPGPARRRRKP
jgi:hypothetical protein